VLSPRTLAVLSLRSTVRADAEEEKYRWWEHQKEDASIKWDTLSHNGVLFPPAYEPLPADVKLKYDGA
jgi:DNA topoisomerase-1